MKNTLLILLMSATTILSAERAVTVQLMAQSNDDSREYHTRFVHRLRDVIESSPRYRVSNDSPSIVYVFAGTTVSHAFTNQVCYTYVIVYEHNGQMKGYANTSMQNIGDMEESAAFLCSQLDDMFPES
jgi:hypothetical protein